MSFIIVKFGYNLTRIFGINCIIATLLDAIKEKTLKDVQRFLKSKEDSFIKEKKANDKAINAINKQIDQLKEQQEVEKKKMEEKKLEEGKENDQEPPVKEEKKASKKEDKKGKKAQEVKPEDKFEIEKLALIKKKEDIEKRNSIMDNKIKKIGEESTRISSEGFLKIIDLQDKNEERKYLKTKTDQYANTVLNEKSFFEVLIIKVDGNLKRK